MRDIYELTYGLLPRFYALIPITLLPKPIGYRHNLGTFFYLYLKGMSTFSSISWIINPQHEDIGGNIRSIEHQINYPH